MYKILIIFIMLLGVSCESEKEIFFSDDLIFVKGATIEGAIQGEGYNESHFFKDGANYTIPDFYIGKHEVTQKEFAMYYEGYEYRVSENEKAIGPNFPAYDVNYLDALVYCNRRSIAEGFTPCYAIDGEVNPNKWGKVPKSSSWDSWEKWKNIECDFTANGYRLPKITEWEYAARGGNGLTGYQFKFAGSDTLSEVAWYNVDSPREVCQKKPNSLGIYDMNGNLDEWCWERYGNDILRRYAGGYYYYKEGQEDTFLLSSLIHSKGLFYRNSQMGFRIVRNAE